MYGPEEAFSAGRGGRRWKREAGAGGFAGRGGVFGEVGLYGSWGSVICLCGAHDGIIRPAYCVELKVILEICVPEVALFECAVSDSKESGF